MGEAAAIGVSGVRERIGDMQARDGVDPWVAAVSMPCAVRQLNCG